MNDKRGRFKNTAFLLVVGFVCSVTTLLIQPFFEPSPGLDPRVLNITPSPADACGMPPSPEDWRVMRDDGTTDAERVTAFAKHISEWDECITTYAESLRDYVFVLEALQDGTIESAGVYFYQFIDPSFAPPTREIPAPPGTFDDDWQFPEDPGILNES